MARTSKTRLNNSGESRHPYLIPEFRENAFSFSPLKIMFVTGLLWVSPGALVVKNLPAYAGDVKRYWFDPWVEKTPWKRAWQPTPVFLPGESHGQRSLAGYSP